MCEQIDNFDGQPLYYCSFGICTIGELVTNDCTIGELVTNDYCLVKCKKDPEVCIFRQPADKYVERRIKKDEMG